jgi:hypothetical protein
MRKLVVQQWVTVDNIAAEEDGGLSFVSGEPFSERCRGCASAVPFATQKPTKAGDARDVLLAGLLAAA